MKLNQKNWSCPKKQKARTETIIDQCHHLFGDKLPKDRQYWTMCGQSATPDGKPLDGCEVSQLLSSGVITRRQFHGVEINPEIHDINVRAYPKLNWHQGDFLSQMMVAKSEGKFNPGIVNADLVQTADGGSDYVSKILAFLSGCPGKMLVVANFIMRMRYYTVKDGDYVLGLLEKKPLFQYAMKTADWKLSDCYYSYGGAGENHSRTYMGSFVFFKI